LLRRRKELKQGLHRLGRELDRCSEDARGAAERLRTLGKEGGLDEGTLQADPRALAERFVERAERRREYDRLRDERAGLAAGRLDPSERESIEAELAGLEEKAATLGREGQGDESPLPPGSTAAEHAAERERHESRLASLQERERELLVSVGSHLDRYERAYPGLAREREAMQELLARARRFDEASRRAIDELGTLSRMTYAEWSKVLNARGGRILGRLGPGYGGLRFEEDLSFSLEDPGGARHTARQVRETFSFGTREQVHLAVRVALGEYLSRDGDPLPLVLDDALTGADDERFARAMEFLLAELSPERQVILLSCHRRRHEAFFEAHPELADLVETRDLSSLTEH
jgi:DNA repair exonuclease SbcCD ATPase subunit